MLRRISQAKELKEDERCAKHEAKLAARRAQVEVKEEAESSGLEEEFFELKDDKKELPLENILADERRKYSSKEEYVYLLYNDLVKDFVKKWDSTYLRKTVIANESYDELSKNYEDERMDESSEKMHESSIDNEKSNTADWKFYSPDEQAEIIFINENTYAGRISRRKMEGQGVYRWRNGSQFKGNFEDNKIQGKGFLEWQDSGWYEGDFQDGYRHGKGTMVDKNYDLLYIGQWHHGRKHGKGYCRFEKGDSYDGDWIMDRREGVGNYIYPSGSRYVGNWKEGLRHGMGTMTWKNGDVYRGEWKNGKMDGYGEYTWNGFFNNTLSWPQEICYMGEWHEGTRKGRGQMTLNSIGGARYSGEWRKNKKHGTGTIIGNNGDLTEGDPLFENDVLLPCESTNNLSKKNEERAEINDENIGKEIHKNEFIEKPGKIPEARVTTIFQPVQRISLRHYTDRLRAIETIETSSSRVSLISEKCRVCEKESCHCLRQSHSQSFNVEENLSSKNLSSKVLKSNVHSTLVKSTIFSQLKNCEIVPSKNQRSKISEISSNLEREEYWIYNCITMHMPRIRNIYDVYSKIFCDVSPNCRLSMSRLSLWQLWRDCGIHKKAMSLVQIDNYLAANKSTLMENSPCPFGKIEIWQLIHALLEVSWHFYGKNEEYDVTGYSGKLADGLEKFLVNDVYPNVGKSIGILCGPERDLVPLYPVYKLYESVGKSHSARQLLAAIFPIRGTCDHQVSPESSLTLPESSSITINMPEFLVEGRNTVIVGEKLSYISNCYKPIINPKAQLAPDKSDDRSGHSLFALRELGTKELIEIMSVVCPSIKDSETGAIVNMQYELTFLEFLEIFVQAGKQLVRMRIMRDEAKFENIDTEERVSIVVSEKDDDTRRSSVRLSTGGKTTKSRKKIVS